MRNGQLNGKSGERRTARAAGGQRVATISQACVDFMLRSAHGIEMIKSWITKALASLAIAKRARLLGIEAWSCAPLAGGPFEMSSIFHRIETKSCISASRFYSVGKSFQSTFF